MSVQGTSAQHGTTTPSLDVTITPENIEEQIRKLVVKIKPDWGEGLVEMKKLTGGVVNFMYCCWNAELGDSTDAIVVRIHNRPEEMMKHPAFDPKKEIVLLEKISPTGLGPELTALFNNGLCYKYIPGEVLNVRTVRSEKFVPHVAKLLARLHALPLLEKDTAMDMKDMLNFVTEYPPKFEDATKLERALAVLPDHETFIQEITPLVDLVPTLDSTRVFCHNDTKGENFVWNEKDGVLRLIDFEHASNNTQASEIARHFTSYNDVLGATPDTYPDREFQLRWIRMYLQYWYEFTGRKANDVTDKDIEKLYVQSNKVAQMLRLIMGVALIGGMPGMPDCYEFCLNNLKDYFKHREEVNAMILPE